MKRRRVLLDPVARSDLRRIRSWIAMKGFPETGIAYVSRIVEFAESLELAAERGQALPEIGAGLRVIPFEAVMLAIKVEEERVVVLRVLHRSQDWVTQLQHTVDSGKR